MSALRCNCCGRVITGATYDAAHTYRLPVFELVRYQGKPAALHVGFRRAAVCAVCVQKIHAAHDRRLAGRRARVTAAV